MLSRATTRALHAARALSTTPARALSAAPARAAQKKKLLGPKKNAKQVRDLLRTRLALTDADLDRMVRRRPLGALTTIKPKLDWLQRRLDLDAAQLARLVRREPTVLTNSVERNNAPTLDWLQTRLEQCGNQNFTRVRPESPRRPPRHRRDACSIAWRCRFLTARPSQDDRVIAEK
jgi:hypothetical protein